MIRKRTAELSVRIEPGVYLYFAFLFLLVPLQCVVALVISVIVHEIGHVIALRLLKIPVIGIILRPLGIQLHTPAISPEKELICAAAGPVSGLCLLLFAKWIPGVALFAAFHSLYNLLPIYPGDGGRIFHNLCRIVLPLRVAERISRYVAICITLLLTTIGLYATFFVKLGLFPAVFGILTAVNAWRSINNPCKADQIGVQWEHS